MAVPRAGARGRSAVPVPANVLVGRAGELADLERLLAAPETRLITLTGPPGVGKTRLAVAAAAAAAARFADGVVFVDLTAVRDPALVPAEVAGALGAPAAADDLAGAVGDRELLLVLDNVEHVLAAAPALAAPLARCPGLRLLATSRERLNVAAEQELPVPPLALPGDAAAGDLGRFGQTPSVALLLQRIAAHQPGYAVSTVDQPALAEICTRLDGLPLALELAAARLRLFTPGELAFRLRHRVGGDHLGADRMELLSGGPRDGPDRHRTLRAALAWSHDLLGPGERALFRRLSVFVGGCTLAAAEEVCGGQVVDALASLVDKSLVVRRAGPGAAAEFVLLESLREFAAEQLARHGERDATRARHARYYAELARRTEGMIGTAQETASVADVGAEQGNLRAALDHVTAGGEIAQALPLAAALGWHAYTRGRLGEGRAVLAEAIAAADAGPLPAPDDALAGALLIASVLAAAAGAADRAQVLLDRSLELDERTGDWRRVAIGTAFRGHLARARGNHREAVAQAERAGELHGELGNAAGVAWSRYDLGLLARRRGDLEAASEHLRESLERFRDEGYAWAVGCAAWPLATVELARGQPGAAAALLGEALDSLETADDGRGLAHCLEAVAALAARCRDPRTAGLLIGAAAALRERLAAPLPDEERDAQRAVAQRVRRELGSDAAERVRRAGRKLSRAAALAAARRIVVAATEPDAAAPENPLTRRELEVAALVAGGRTNRQIGRELGIAEKTSEVHVHNIIRKLGARSRAEVAAWMAVRNPHARRVGEPS